LLYGRRNGWLLLDAGVGLAPALAQVRQLDRPESKDRSELDAKANSTIGGDAKSGNSSSSARGDRSVIVTSIMHSPSLSFS
jgi:hypothetical protein